MTKIETPFAVLRESIRNKSKQLQLPHQLAWYNSKSGSAIMGRYPGAGERDLMKVVRHIAFDLPNDNWVVALQPGPIESLLIAYHTKQTLDDVFDEMRERGHLNENKPKEE